MADTTHVKKERGKQKTKEKFKLCWFTRVEKKKESSVEWKNRGEDQRIKNLLQMT